MKKTDRFKRIAAATEAVCQGEEEDYARKQFSLAQARQHAEKLSAIGAAPQGAMALLPEIWCAQLTKTFAEIARLDDEVTAQARQLHMARARRDKADERLREARTRDRVEKEARSVEQHLEIARHASRIRLR